MEIELTEAGLSLEDCKKQGITLDIVCEDDKYLPEYANPTDACMDLKVKVNNTEKKKRTVRDDMDVSYTDTQTSLWIMPNESRVFDSGIQVSVPKDYVMMVFPRSSTGFKLHCMLANTTGIIDALFFDIIKVKLYNYGSEPVEITDGQRVAQFMIIPRPYIYLNRVKDDDAFRKGDRGGGIGSTGK